MDVVMPRVMELHENRKLGWGLTSLLTQGVDECMQREKEKMNNFAITSALVMTISMAAALEPPPELSGKPRTIYGAMMVLASFLFFICIGAVVHIQNMWGKHFRCDADVFLFHLSVNWEMEIVMLWMIVPMILGITIVACS